MIQYNSASVKLSNQQLNKFNIVTANATEVTLKLSLSIICNFNDETSFSLELLLTDRRLSNIRKTFFANNLSTNTKLSNPLKTGLILMKNVSKPLTEYILKAIG